MNYWYSIRNNAECEEEIDKLPETLSRDEVIVNLKILADVQVNDKLRITGKYLCKDDSYKLIQPLFRKFKNDNRTKIVDFLDHVIQKSFEYLNQDINCKLRYCNTQHFLSDFKTSIRGIERLKITYAGDLITMHRLQLIIEKIQNFINDSNLQIQSKIGV